MNRSNLLRPLLGLFLMGGLALAAEEGHCGPLEGAVFTELDGKVWVLDEGQALRPAVLKAQVGGRSMVRTGERSRAEMEFADRSLVRLGASAVFAFRPGTRELRLDEGAMLLHVPKGVGGTTTVRTASATAAITGTTVIISATAGGGFRMVVLEGVAEVRYNDGQRLRCRAGDMSTRQKGEPPPKSPVKVHLDGLVNSSALLGGFKARLVSLPLIREAVRVQTLQIGRGSVVPTGTTVGATTLVPKVDAARIDGARITTAVSGVSRTTVQASTLQANPTLLQNRTTLDPKLQTDLKRFNTLPPRP